MSRIIVTQGVRGYRQTIPRCVTKHDVVLEIGCATGTTSVWLFQQARHHCRQEHQAKAIGQQVCRLEGLVLP